jgi:hypothetical protein
MSNIGPINVGNIIQQLANLQGQGGVGNLENEMQKLAAEQGLLPTMTNALGGGGGLPGMFQDGFDPGAGGAGNDKKLMQAIQDQKNAENEAAQLESNLKASDHQTKMAIINNIK